MLDPNTVNIKVKKLGRCGRIADLNAPDVILDLRVGGDILGYF